MKIIQIDSLHQICNQSNCATHFKYTDKCTSCGLDVEIEITKTSGGYGLIGGVLYEPEPKVILAICADCYAKCGDRN